MPAFTSFLNLYKPGGGSTGLITPDEVVDVDRINQNSDLIDAWAVKVGNESTRQVHYAGLAAAMGGALVPPPKDGDTYQETDGNKILWRRVGGVWVTNEGGLYLLRPSSVVNGTVNPDGSISPTSGQTTCSLNGIFSPRFRKYRFDFYFRFAAGCSLTAVLRNAGADYVGATYTWTTLEGDTATVGYASFTNQPSMNVSPKLSNQNHWGEFYVSNPAHAGTDNLKTFYAEAFGAFSVASSTAVRNGIVAGVDGNTYDGLTLKASSAWAAPSWVRVYGLA